MAARRAPGADAGRSEKGRGADSERLPLRVRLERKESSPQTQGSELGAERGSGTNPAPTGAQAIPEAKTRERSGFFPRQSEASRPLQGPRPRAAAAARLRKEAVPAPPRAAPTSWRKNSFPKLELGSPVPLTSFLCCSVSMPIFKNRVVPLQNSN